MAVGLSAAAACSTEPGVLFSIGGAVAGTVVTSTQAPIPGAQVSASAQYPLPRGTLSLVGAAVTDADGRFRLGLGGAGNLPDTIAFLSLHVTATGYVPLDTAGLRVRIVRIISSTDTTFVVLSMVRSN